MVLDQVSGEVNHIKPLCHGLGAAAELRRIEEVGGKHSRQVPGVHLVANEEVAYGIGKMK